MTKVTIDRALIEHATELFERQVMGEVPWSLMEAHQAEFALRAALAEPAVEPVMWAWQRDDGSWYDASATHHSRGMKPLYASPPPAEPAVEPVGYLAFRDGKPAWDEDCVCEDAVYPVDSDDDRVSVAIYTAPPPPAEPAVEPVAYRYKYLNFMGDEVWSQDMPRNGKVLGTQALYTAPPPPAEPATVPLLSDEEILQLTPLWFKKYTDGVLLGHARAIEQLVRRKAGL